MVSSLWLSTKDTCPCNGSFHQQEILAFRNWGQNSLLASPDCSLEPLIGPCDSEKRKKQMLHCGAAWAPQNHPQHQMWPFIWALDKKKRDRLLSSSMGLLTILGSTLDSCISSLLCQFESISSKTNMAKLGRRRFTPGHTRSHVLMHAGSCSLSHFSLYVEGVGWRPGPAKPLESGR